MNKSFAITEGKISVAALVFSLIALGTVFLPHRSNHHRPHHTTDWAAVIAGASGGKAHLVKTFAGTRGLVGLVVAGNGVGGKRMVSWGLPGPAPLVITGAVFNARGTDETRLAGARELGQGAAFGAAQPMPTNPSAVESAVGQPPSTPQAQPDTPASLTAAGILRQAQSHPLSAADFYAVTSQAHGVTVGGGTRKLYVYFDANCPFCHDLYMTLSGLRADLTKQGVAVVWVPVAILHAQSGPRGAAILQGGVRALAYNEDHFHAGREQGGITPVTDHAAALAIAQNTVALMQSGRQLATPTLVWRDARGQTHIEIGAPTGPDLSKILADIGDGT